MELVSPVVVNGYISNIDDRKLEDASTEGAEGFMLKILYQLQPIIRISSNGQIIQVDRISFSTHQVDDRGIFGFIKPILDK